jgi:hypothetical protein
VGPEKSIKTRSTVRGGLAAYGDTSTGPQVENVPADRNIRIHTPPWNDPCLEGMLAQLCILENVGGYAVLSAICLLKRKQIRSYIVKKVLSQ